MYSLVKNAHYVVTSPDEVVVKGSSLEGFTMVISDESKRGLAASIVEALRNGVVGVELYAEISKTVDIAPAELEDLLNSLVASGALSRTDSLRSEDAWVAFARFGTVPANLRTLTLFDNGPVGPALADALGALGIPTQVASGLDEIDLDLVRSIVTEGEGDETTAFIPRVISPLVVIGGDGSRDRLYGLNEFAIQERISYLHLSVSGVESCIGPYVVPGASACFWEFERQWAMTSPSENFAQMLETHLATTEAAQRMVSKVGFNFLTSLATPWLCELAVRGVSSLMGEVIRGRATSSHTGRHRIMRVPRCPSCLSLAPLGRNPLY